MKKTPLFLVPVVVVGIISCSGGPSTLADACDQAMSSICTRIYGCFDTQTIRQTLGYTSQGDCVTKLQSTANCVNQTCPQGRTFNSANANTCINDINTEACNQLGTQPPSCTAAAICQ